MGEEVEVESPYNMVELREYGFERLEETAAVYEEVTSGFLSGMGPLGGRTGVVAVHRYVVKVEGHGRDKQQAFLQVITATADNRGGTAVQNAAMAYLIGSSREDICNIAKNGFTRPDPSLAAALPYYGIGSLVLVPSRHSLISALSSLTDECGLRHVLLCCVVMGRSEVVSKDSEQTRPSSQEFDSGVDDLVNPSRYVVWGDFIATHIFPYYIVTFTAPQILEAHSIIRLDKLRFIYEDHPSIRLFLVTLPRIVNEDKLQLVQQLAVDFRAQRIRGRELLRIVRDIIGDELLKKVTAWVRNRFL